MAVGFLFRLRLANLRVAVKQSSRETGIFKLLFVILLQTIEGPKRNRYCIESDKVSAL